MFFYVLALQFPVSVMRKEADKWKQGLPLLES